MSRDSCRLDINLNMYIKEKNDSGIIRGPQTGVSTGNVTATPNSATVTSLPIIQRVASHLFLLP